MGVCCCLQIFNSVLYVLVMWLVLGKGLMVISTMGIPLYTKVSPFIMYYGSALLLFTPKVHCLQTFEHRTALWAIKAVTFIYISTRVFEISRETCKRNFN